MALPIDFKDDILAESMGGLRRYRMIQNSDGTVSFEDATEYTQVGSGFGGKEVNETNAAVNKLEVDKQDSLFKGTAAEESMDNIVEPGVYWVRKVTVLDAPATYGFLEVSKCAETSDAILQKFYAYSNARMYSRMYINEQWYEWSFSLTKADTIDNMASIAGNSESGKIAGALVVKELYEQGGKLITGVASAVSSYVDTTSSTHRVDYYKCGRLCMLSINIYFNKTVNEGVTILSGFPAPLKRFPFVATAEKYDGSTKERVTLIINTNGALETDDAVTTLNFVYFTAIYVTAS